MYVDYVLILNHNQSHISVSGFNIYGYRKNWNPRSQQGESLLSLLVIATQFL